MAPKIITVALIGAGMVAQTHLRAIADLEKAGVLRLSRVVDRNLDRTQELVAEFGKRFESVVVSVNVEDVSNDPEIDFAIVATPPYARTDIVRSLADSGKHLLLEKPIARTLAESTEIVNYAAEARVKFGVVFQHRAREASRAAAGLVASGKLGPLQLVEAQVPWWRNQSYYDEPGRGTYERDGGGVLISQAIHTIDLMMSLAGPVQRVTAMVSTTGAHKMEAENFANAGLRFENGAVGYLTASTASFPGGAESLTLHFQNASLNLCSGILKLHWRNGEAETFGQSMTTGGGADPMAFTHDWHQTIIEEFAKAITNDGEPTVTGAEALQSSQLIEAIERSSRLECAQEVTT